MSRPNRGIQGSAGELLEFRTMPVECEGRWSVDAGATDKWGSGQAATCGAAAGTPKKRRWGGAGAVGFFFSLFVFFFHVCPFLKVEMIALAPRAANRFMAALGGIHPRRH